MPRQIGVRQLRDTLPATLRQVRDGETIEVTHHGKPVALLSPVRANRIDRLLARGDVRPATPLSKPLLRFPVIGEISASQAIEEDRSER